MVIQHLTADSIIFSKIIDKEGENKIMKNFVISNENAEFLTGKTHMFGSPDAPEYFEWPVTTSRYGDDIDMTFLAQINCKDLESELLPKEGILYFFYNAAEQPATPNVKGAAKVFWFNENEDELATLRLVDSDGNDLSPDPLSLIPSEEDYNVSVISDPEDLELTDDGDEDEFFDEFEEFEEDEEDGGKFNATDDMIVLASFKAYEDDTVSFVFEKGNELCFLINKNALAEKDFSDIRVLIV